MEINKAYNENCLDTMARMPDGLVDLTVTSPPYDNLRDYEGYHFDFESIAKELFRVTKEGGIVVWVVGDSTKNFCESLTSFKQAIYFVDDCGFNLFDTMIYSKGSQGGAKGSNYAYTQSFEYMFVFCKGKIGTHNLIKDHKNSYKFNGNKKSSMRKEHGKTIKFETQYNEFSKRPNVWDIRGGYMVGSSDKIAFDHPATFPESLARDHIISWSNKDDLIYDPMMGSGTVAKMAIQTGRNWIGSELSEKYCEIIEERISGVQLNMI